MTAENPFVPDDYEVSQGNSSYMKFEEGKNKFRFLSAPLLGWVWWVDSEGKVRAAGDKPSKGDKPVRIKRGEEIPAAARGVAKEFWAMPVWNYDAQKIQLLEVTQKGILKTLVTYIRDTDWGSPLKYDLQVVRTGKGLETEYEVMAIPPKELPAEVKTQFDEMSINLEALLEGGDPFGGNEGKDEVAATEEEVVIEDMA